VGAVSGDLIDAVFLHFGRLQNFEAVFRRGRRSQAPLLQPAKDVPQRQVEEKTRKDDQAGGREDVKLGDRPFARTPELYQFVERDAAEEQ
jgi:hypothetical protein